MGLSHLLFCAVKRAGPWHFLTLSQWWCIISYWILVSAAVVKLADTRDLKSRGSDTVRVRPPSAAPKNPAMVFHGGIFSTGGFAPYMAKVFIAITLKASGLPLQRKGGRLPVLLWVFLFLWEIIVIPPGDQHKKRQHQNIIKFPMSNQNYTGGNEAGVISAWTPKMREQMRHLLPAWSGNTVFMWIAERDSLYPLDISHIWMIE